MSKKAIQKNTALPEFHTPDSLNAAANAIIGLGSSLAEHAYLIGSNLIWVKSQLKHGEFLEWIEKNLWFSIRFAQKVMRFSERCNKQKHLLPYQEESNAHTVRISNKPAEIEPGQKRTVIIDPPWPYTTHYDPDTRRVASPYPEMTLEAITATEFPFADDCVLWLWTTHKFIEAAFDMLEAWDFDYKATLVWDKQAMGIGYWLRMQCEFCLLAIRGNPIWEATDVRDIISEQGREHSRKPEAFYKMILEICPKPIGEAFARQERKGIEVITGNERNKFAV